MTIAGKHLLLGRSGDDCVDLTRKLSAFGATVACVPLISVQPIANVDSAVIHPKTSVVVLTSRNSLASYAALLPTLPHHILATVGAKTADACGKIGVSPAVVGSGKGALALLSQLAETISLSGAHILYPCSTLVADDFDNEAKKYGAWVQRLPVYQTLVPRELTQARLLGFDAAVFYSSSGAENYFSLVPPTSVSNMVAVALGNQTASTLRTIGVQHVVVSDRPESAALLDAVVTGLHQPNGELQ